MLTNTVKIVRQMCYLWMKFKIGIVSCVWGSCLVHDLLSLCDMYLNITKIRGSINDIGGRKKKGGVLDIWTSGHLK